MKLQERIEQLQPFQARAIIEGLRKGIVPAQYVSSFTVGRENWLQIVEEDLEDFIAQGGGKARFVNGDYGDGKTHFMSVIQQLALQKKFASSFVVLTREVPIHKFEVIYQEIVAQLRGCFHGVGIRSCIRDWLNEQEKIDCDEQAFSDSLRQMPGMALSFANALLGIRQLYFSSVEDSEDKDFQEILYQWFEGKKVAKKDLKKFHVFETLNKTNSKQFLQSLVAFLRFTEHQGFVLLLDELETVIAQSTSIRNSAYENVRLLMDNTDHVQYIQLFFSLIPDVLLSEKGFKSYDALWIRIRSMDNTEEVNYRGTLIDLHKTPLKREELVQLGISLRKIHEISYRWSALESVPDDLIERTCFQQEKVGALSEIRLFIKQIIRLLDMAEQGNMIKDTDLVQNLIDTQKESEEEKLRQLEPVWDA